MKSEVLAAGFEFVGKGGLLLRNPADDHSLAVFDNAITGTDKFITRFASRAQGATRVDAKGFLTKARHRFHAPGRSL